MLDAAREAVAFGAGKTAQDLKSDRVLSLALVKCIEIIGEAATKVTNETRAAYPQIPWADIVGTRHRLIHVYFDVDLERVCDTIALDLPPLIGSLEQMILGAT
jgi:uncharacterized protein with HEPN domain